MSLFVPSIGQLVRTMPENLAVDVTSVAMAPVYTTLMTTALTTVRLLSDLDIRFYGSFSHTGGIGVGRAINVRFRLNGVLIAASRGLTENEIVNRIHTVALERVVVGVTSGVQTVIAEWGYFGPAGGTMRCRPATLPDLEGAQLVLQEIES